MSAFGLELNIWFLEHQVESLKRYLTAIEEFIAKETERLNKTAKELEEKRPALDEGTGPDLDDYLANLAFEVNELKELTLSSFSVSVMVSLEQTLAYLCDAEKVRRKQAFSYNEMTGSRGIGQALNYLKKIFGNEEFPFDSKSIEILNAAIIIRNAAMHADAKIRGDAKVKSIKEFGEKYPGLLEFHDLNSRAGNMAIEVTVTLGYAKLLLNLHTDIIAGIERHIREAAAKEHGPHEGF